MSTLRLFDPKPRTDPRHKRADESNLEFYDRVGPSPYWDGVRALMNDWLEHHPEPAALRPRFSTVFDAAFWELYVHELFRRLGFTGVVEPAGTQHRPDFAFSRGSDNLRVECWMSASSGFDRVYEYDRGRCEIVRHETEQIEWLRQLLDDRIRSSTFGVRLEHVSVDGNRPSWRSVCHPVQEWVDGNPRVGEWREFVAGAWSFVLEQTSSPTRGHPFVLSYPPFSPVAERPIQALITGLQGKARKDYLAAGDDVLIIAANWPSTFLSREEVKAALLGNDGLWSRGHASHVSAVLLGRYIQPATIGCGLPVLWVGPRGLPISLPFETIRCGSTDLASAETVLRPHELFGLPEGWGTASPFAGVDD